MRLLGLICATALAAAAQTVDGVNVSVSRSVNITPDQAEFSVIVATTLDLPQQQVAQVLRDIGAPDPVVVNIGAGIIQYTYPPPVDSQFFYQMTFVAAPSAVKDLAKKLDALRAALPEGFAAMQYSAAFTASAGAVERARKSTLPLLIAEARAKAETLAEAAGVKLGAILGASDFSTGYGVPSSYMLSNFLSSGSFSYSSPGYGTLYTFSATIKFATQ